MSKIRATGILASIAFAAIAGAQQPAKPAAMKHDSTKKAATAAAPMTKAAATPAAAPAPMGKAAPAAMKHDSTKHAAKPAAKKPGV